MDSDDDHIIMDNFRFAIDARGRRHLLAALEIVFAATSYAVGYRVDLDNGKNRLILYGSPASHRMTRFPFKMKAPQAADFMWSWLAEQEYGKEPDHDGDNAKGWRLYNEAWGHVDGEHAAFVAVEPLWAMLGK